MGVSLQCVYDSRKECMCRRKKKVKEKGRNDEDGSDSLL
jgi:hypothetical protein